MTTNSPEIIRVHAERLSSGVTKQLGDAVSILLLSKLEAFGLIEIPEPMRSMLTQSLPDSDSLSSVSDKKEN
jgi:hypothetical protein